MLPDTVGTFPLVIYIHGGGFTGGDRDVILSNGTRLQEIKYFLEQGIAYASMGYRLIETTGQDTVGVKKCVGDSKLGLQTIRYFADQLHIDPDRIALIGSSAGAGTSVWLGTRSDMADPVATNPVLGMSTRVCAVVALGTQGTYDLYRWESEVYHDYDGQGTDYTVDSMSNLLSFQRFSNFYGGLDSNYHFLYDSALIQYRQDMDMFYHMSSDDPSLYINNPSTAVLPSQDVFHHALQAKYLNDYAINANLSELKANIPYLNINTTGGESSTAFLERNLNNCSLTVGDPPSLALNAILAPSERICSNGVESVSIEVVNNGTTTITNFQAGFSVNEDSIVEESFVVNLEMGDTTIVTFATAANLITGDEFMLTAFVSADNDVNTTDDTLSQFITFARDVFEPNDNVAAELPLVGVLNNAAICDALDRDLFKFLVQPDRPNVQITYKGGGELVYMRLTPYDPSGSLTIIDSTSTDTSGEAILTLNGIAAQSYMIELEGGGALMEPDSYYLRVQHSDTPFSIRTDLDEAIFEDQFLLYPNPNTDQFHLQFSIYTVTNLDIRIVDIYGKEVFRESGTTTTGENRFSFNLAGVAEGIYFVGIRLEGHSFAKRMQIVR